MNAVQAFFKKYNGVPAGESGPRWGAADLDSLLGWYEQDVSLLPRLGGQDAYVVRDRLNAILKEMWRRVKNGWAECASLPAGSPTHNTVGRILAALAKHAGGLVVEAR